jgi:uncharacterized repeat protein (TIGR03803 family)
VQVNLNKTTMKKQSYFFFILIAFVFNARGQMLYGLTSLGGDSGGGVLFNYDAANLKDSLAYSFPLTSPKYPQFTTLIQATDGYLYGMSYYGGSANKGMIFKCSTSGVLNLVASFNGPNGAYPFGSLIQASDGYLYGMTSQGGDSNLGVIFKCSTTGSFTTLVNFHGLNGSTPEGSLMQASDSNLYGMTVSGGTLNKGIIFKCTTTGTITKLLDFNSTNGANPYGSLIQGSDGNLYGMTCSGGSGAGNIFKCTTSGTIANLYNFTGAYTSGGAAPYGSLIQASDGNFYGMTAGGGSASWNSGVIFQYDTTTKSYNELVVFQGTNGSMPEGSLIQASDGNLYGLTEYGGPSSNGNLFKCTTTGTITTMIDFPTGVAPQGSLLQASDGNLYGMTYCGGAPGYGTIFKCSLAGVWSNIYTMGPTAIGNTPYGSVIKASDGNLYGLTKNGGANGDGSIFKYIPSTGKMSTLVNFNSVNGSTPYGDLIQGTDGNLYGMTYSGGSANEGAIFKCSLSGTLTVLKSIGKYPEGSIMQASDGYLYGMTQYGGSSGEGNIFKCSTSGAYTDIYDFSAYEYPSGTLMQASDGNLYGTTSGVIGGGNNGTLFRLTLSDTLTTIVNFDTTKGSNPINELMQASDGYLYGMTYAGGVYKDGTVFRCSTTGNITFLADFNDTNGAQPYGALIQASDGNLYGMTNTGGSSNYGTLFKCNTSGTVTKLMDFNTTNGATPMFGKLLEYGTSPTSVTQINTLDFIVAQNQPNPFKTNTVITYSLTKESDVSFKVCDIMGQELITYNYSNMNTGEHSIVLNASQFTPGIYLYTIIANGQTVTKEMVKK